MKPASGVPYTYAPPETFATAFAAKVANTALAFATSSIVPRVLPFES